MTGEGLENRTNIEAETTLKRTNTEMPKALQPEVAEVKDIKIKEQRIFTHVNVDELTFKGYTEIQFSCLPEDDSVLKIDSKDLEILKVTNGNKEIEFELDEKNSKILIKSKISSVSSIEICYSGTIKANMEGLYVSNYTHPEFKKKSKIISTHFEPSYARQAFPCFDHPFVKTVFKLAVSTNKDLTVLSNSEVAKEEPEFIKTALNQEYIRDEFSDKYSVTCFEDTPLMSTYLIAFAIGKFDKLSKGRTEIYSPFSIADGALALEIGEFSLNFYEKFFGIEFPLKKLKHVAIPEFSMGAMENWGLVTYRMTSLMHSSNSSLRSKKNMLLTVAHEIAHQWFGNLVTMKWWDDLWLNEGFATWCEYFAVDYCVKHQGKILEGLEVPDLKLKYDLWTDFISETTEPGLSLDAMKSSHPVHSYVSRVEEIEQLFDAISYNKGSALIRMMHDFAGNRFFPNLKSYINEYKYSNATKEDLFTKLGSGIGDGGPKLKDVMDVWINKQGFPLLLVSESENKLKIRQDVFVNGCDRLLELKSVAKRFILDNYQHLDEEIDTKKKDDDVLWPVPIKINWDGQSKEYLMTGKCIEIEKQSENYVVNDTKVGFYRVFYTNPEKQALCKEIKTQNVISYISDLYALVKNGYLGLNAFMENVYFSDKHRNLFTNYHFLDSVSSYIISLKNVFYERDEFFNDFLRNFVKNDKGSISEIIDFKLEHKYPDDIMELNVLKLSIAIEVANKTELEEIYQLVAEKDVDPAYLSLKYKLMMKCRNLFDEMLEISQNGDFGQKLAARINLGSSETREVYEKGVKLIVGDEINAGDKLYLSTSLLRNRKLRNIFCKFFFENLTAVWNAYKNNSSLFSRVLESAIATCDEPIWKGIEIFEGCEEAYKKGVEKFEMLKVFRESNLNYLGIKPESKEL